MRRIRIIGALSLLAATIAVGSSFTANAGAAGSDVRLNQMQVIGSHNSYHIEPEWEPNPDFDPDYELAYSHTPLPEQFSHEGVRQIELDVWADPDGTLWRPMGVPGFKVFHIQGVDMGSTCETLADCLNQVKGWSDSHSAHMPITILLEVKDDPLPIPPAPLPITTERLDQLDTEIRSIFSDDDIITPDDIRGAHSTLEDAVLDDGWPRIDDVRGQVMFLLDNHRAEYIVGHPSLEGRVAFTPSAPGQPDAAFVERNDPLGANTAEIQQLVTDGYVVRTRADEPTFQARANDTTMRDAALESGAQWVSTDYPVPGIASRWNGSTYVAQIPGGTPARCNPVNAPDDCSNTDIENLPPDPVSTPPEEESTASTAPVSATASPRFTG